MDNSYTRLRAFRIEGGGLSASYSVDMEFSLIGGRFCDSIKAKIIEEMQIAGCDSIDLLHIPSWESVCCQPDELQELLQKLEPSDIEIPSYQPKDETGKASRKVIMDYCALSPISELIELTPKTIRKYSNDDVKRQVLLPSKTYETPTNNDIVSQFFKGRFSVFNTGYLKSEQIVEIICKRDLKKVDVMLLNDGIGSNSFIWGRFINKFKPAILIDNQTNEYYKLGNVNLETMGISTKRTESGDVLITSGVRRNDSEIDATIDNCFGGMQYKTEL